MRKEEFLEKLRARLSQTMSQQEVTAQIRYYENYIQEQIQNGRSEEEDEETCTGAEGKRCTLFFRT